MTWSSSERSGTARWSTPRRGEKLDVHGIAGRWETSLVQVVQHPLPGVARAFVIAGSDQRGTIFGAYDVSSGSEFRPGTGGTT